MKKKTETLESFIKDFDFILLKAQKRILNKLQDKKKTTHAESQAIEGIINLIESIQDIAVDQFGLEEDIVFNFENKLSTKDCKKIVIKG